MRQWNLVIVTAVLLAACSAPTPTSAPTAPAPSATPAATVAATALPAATEPAAATQAPAAAALPFAHTDCAKGVDLTGQTINLYHMINASDHSDPFAEPGQFGYTDAAAYLDAHGGICGATIGNVFPDPSQSYNGIDILARWAALTPKPALVAMNYYGDEEFLRHQFAADQIPALGVRIGSDTPLYGADRQTPSWIFATEPLWADQIGALCDYVAAHRDRYPHPVIGFLSWDWAPAVVSQQDVAAGYCQKHGVAFAGAETTTGADVYTVQHEC